ncbi:unnamed protein product [Macrosiphum euphorbiae]|uniref:Uncharacterized protein n=1 Tax=Macrosiphum euphorbiae TaxID=13131 RepID=A0AAV0X1F6_9HEMI|nr:unnamed protein product [Macrosiphum euphorbiae]
MTFEDHKRCLFKVDDDDDKAADGAESEEVGDDDEYDYMEDDFDDGATLKGEELKRPDRSSARSMRMPPPLPPPQLLAWNSPQHRFHRTRRIHRIGKMYRSDRSSTASKRLRP